MTTFPSLFHALVLLSAIFGASSYPFRGSRKVNDEAELLPRYRRHLQMGMMDSTSAPSTYESNFPTSSPGLSTTFSSGMPSGAFTDIESLVPSGEAPLELGVGGDAVVPTLEPTEAKITKGVKSLVPSSEGPLELGGTAGGDTVVTTLKPTEAKTTEGVKTLIPSAEGPLGLGAGGDTGVPTLEPTEAKITKGVNQTIGNVRLDDYGIGEP